MTHPSILSERGGLFLRPRKGDAILWAALLLALLVAMFLLNPWKKTREELPLSFLSGSPIRGAVRFSSLGCSSCHSLYGVGPGLGPDLAKPGAANWNPVRLVADMWSHSPQMWEKMKDAQFGIPRISEGDMLDLLTYLYLIRYVDQPGDPEKGKVLFASKRCAGCHASEGAPRTGPDLSTLGGDTPIIWAQRMWNHGRGMQQAMAERSIAWPTFQGQEMVDLLTYIQQNSTGKRREVELFPADPENGESQFFAKGCVSCHAINGEGGKGGPDLGSPHPVPPSITQFAGLMWNHSPQMLARMDPALLDRTQFAEREMADLIAFLYVVRYLEPAGRVDKGKEVFAQKHCANCHGTDGGGGKGGPSLARRPLYLSTTMAYTLWSHGPQMYRKMRDRNIAWPTLDEQELVDLIAFLNSL